MVAGIVIFTAEGQGNPFFVAGTAPIQYMPSHPRARDISARGLCRGVRPSMSLFNTIMKRWTKAIWDWDFVAQVRSISVPKIRDLTLSR